MASLPQRSAGQAGHLQDHNSLHYLMPTGESIVVKTKTGVPSDTDFVNASTLSLGTVAVDTQNGRTYVRTGVNVWTLAGAAKLADLSDTAVTAPTTNQVLTWNGTHWAPAAAQGAATPEEFSVPWSFDGTLVTTAGTKRWYADKSYTIVQVRSSVTTSANATIRTNVFKNGTTIFALDADKPNIPATTGKTDVADAISVTSLVAGDYLVAGIDTVGTSGGEGANLTTQVLLRRV